MTNQAAATQSKPNDLRVAKSANTQKRILETATRLFLSDGYSNTSLEKVASEAGVTKPTVYSHFKSKNGLFDAVIEKHAAKRIKELANFLEPSEDPHADLLKIGRLLMSKILGKDSVRWDRLAAAESINHPEIGAKFYNVGPAQVFGRLANYFELQSQANRLHVANPAQAAEMFVAMLISIDALRIQIGQPVASEAKRKQRLHEAVALFMASYGDKPC